ncbi:MAG: metal-dependent transcriptional regulator [Bacteroidota bacterium]
MTSTVEKYLKTLTLFEFQDGNNRTDGCTSSELAERLAVAPSSVNNMVKKLQAQALVDFEAYGKIHLTEKGRLLGVELLRKNRIWKAFLADYLNFSWHEINEIAEQLEHVKSHKLIARVEELLGFPRFDPHGEPIPDKVGTILVPLNKPLSELAVGKEGYVLAVKDSSFDFLSFADRMDLKIGKSLKVLSKNSYEGLIALQTENGTHTLTEKSALNFLITCPICVKGKNCGKTSCIFSE